ncbi:uncharacterized protein MYCFIDRAFT_82347 [Pseudocercospora fijiensis CIRAD86]|uniref:Uncharacterized protein n=1 Tax=Pseudocercospora fijiensis (strain CIRAD86) TaxID=383855 RepID=M2YXK0_PSEFD|nr:uncharacterized protein MYCFIDRAFT_82347 [Pseudocercospora fijiensis CIRAD86]EME82430.1 hypothetical protein MYCFIDRAFT_82347 [Pseudocercospora fijiensis CIRAD86]
MAEQPPRGRVDHNMSPPRSSSSSSIHPDQAPPPLQTRPSSRASSGIQAPPMAVPVMPYGLNPSTGQQAQQVPAAANMMGPPPLQQPTRSVQASGTNPYSPGSSSGQHIQPVPPTPSMMGPPPLLHSAGAMPANGPMPYSFLDHPMSRGPAPFIVPHGMMVGAPNDILASPDIWPSLGMTPPGTPLRRQPAGGQPYGARSVSPAQEHPGNTSSWMGSGRGFGGIRIPAAIPTHVATARRVAAARSGRASPSNANNRQRNPRPFPTVVTGPDPPSGSSSQEDRRIPSTLHNASPQRPQNYLQHQFRPPAAAINSPHPQNGISFQENQILPTTTQSAPPSDQSSPQARQNPLPQQFQHPVTAMNNSDPQNSMLPPESRGPPTDTQHASPNDHAKFLAMINSSSQSDGQNPQGEPFASSSLQRRADNIIPASEPARKRPRLDGAFSPAEPSSGSDLPARCADETSGAGAAAPQGLPPQRPRVDGALSAAEPSSGSDLPAGSAGEVSGDGAVVSQGNPPQQPRVDGALSAAEPSSGSDLPARCADETSGAGAAAPQGLPPQRPRVDGALSAAEPSSGSDLPAGCADETTSDGAAVPQSPPPQPPSLQDFLRRRQENARAEGRTPAVIRDAPLTQNIQELLPLDGTCPACGINLGSSTHPAQLAARISHLENCIQRIYSDHPSEAPPLPLTDFWSDEQKARSLCTSDMEIDLVSNRILQQEDFRDATNVYLHPATTHAWKTEKLPKFLEVEAEILKMDQYFPMRAETREVAFKRMEAKEKARKARKEVLKRALKEGGKGGVTLAKESMGNRGE